MLMLNYLKSRFSIKKPIKTEVLNNGQFIIESNLFDFNLAFAEQIINLKEKAKNNVETQVGKLGIQSLETKALNIIRKNSDYDDVAKTVKSKVTGVISLLEAGEVNFLLYSDLLKEKFIVSSLLQSFGNATEIMIYVSFIHIADEDDIIQFVKNNYESVKSKDRKSLRDWIETLNNPALAAILKGYREMRNLAAHTYQPIPMDAAKSFIQRTYENIQRLELIINPL